MQKKVYITVQGKTSDVLLQSGKATTNEEREKWGLLPIDSGDKHFTKVQCDAGQGVDY